MKEKKLRKKMRKRAMKLLQFAADNGIEHVSMFVVLDSTGEDYVNVHVECDGTELTYAAFPEKGWDSWS